MPEGLQGSENQQNLCPTACVRFLFLLGCAGAE